MTILITTLSLLILFSVIVIGNATVAKRAKQYASQVRKAEDELRNLCTPMHLFSSEEKDAFQLKYASLVDIIERKVLYSIFKVKQKEVWILESFVRDFRSLDAIKKRNNILIADISDVNISIPYAVDDYKSIFTGTYYVAENQKTTYLERWKNLFDKITRLKYEGYETYFVKEWEVFRDEYLGVDAEKVRLNQLFVKNELQERKNYFDHLLKYPLDSQQREAVVTMEDNCLVVSSAGSGKTSTIEGRVHYLVDHLHIDPSKILLMTYTNKAADSLSERLCIEGLKCYTFHKLASKIISDETGVKPSFADESLKKITFDELVKDKDFLCAVNDYFSNYFAVIDEFDYANARDYYEAFRKRDNKAFFPDMRGQAIFTRSGQEKKICYYLSINGVRFLYENPYEYPTADLQHRQYRPDFTIEFTDEQGIRRRLYYEHFGINSRNETPRWFGQGKEGGWEKANEKYLAGIEWKRETHRRNGTTLMETTSADFEGNNFEEILIQKLRSYGVPICPKPPQEIYKQIVETNPSIAKEFSRLLESFLSLMKSGCKTVNDINPDIIQDSQQRRQISFMFERIITPYCLKYQSMLEDRGEIDFTDAIIKATQLCTSNPITRYEHIIVDEFQDISFDRFHFIQALRSKSPFTYLFCVGDDWQSIYRFAGSDMALFKRFEDFFGFTKSCPIETTYRFGEPLISKASEFILKNPIQTKKSVRPFSADRRSGIIFHEYTDSTLGSTIKNILSDIPEQDSVLFLGRYGFDISILRQIRDFSIKEYDDRGEIKYNNRTFKFLSVHKAKGLEADHVILLSCNSGFYGFPSNIADDPVLRLVLSEDDQYEYGEERRLFYVAITRCKKNTHVLYDEDYPSVFVREFIPGLPEEEICPYCKIGKRLLKRKGIARNGSPYEMFGCSNYKYGCDYFEIHFENSYPTWPGNDGNSMWDMYSLD